MMTIALLATGDELIYGDTLNTNGRDIAHILSAEGLLVGLQLTCSDKETEIVTCLEFLSQEHDVLIIIGGLGPTTDDLTRFALAQFTSDTLIEREEALLHIQNRLNPAKITMNAGNRQQSLFPKTAQLLDNPYGTAMGCIHYWKNKTLILLPGPPKECLPMFQQLVLPLLQQSIHTDKTILRWRIFGLAESEIGETLEQAVAPFECKTGYRLEVPYIEFKVWCTNDQIEQVKLAVDPILEPYIIAPVEKKASTLLRETILNNRRSLTLIDEATGGVLETLLVTPGTHELIHTYGEKQELLFHIKGLNNYWSKESNQSNTQLVIEYEYKNQRGEEMHEIPFRNANVIYYAAEWLSYRIDRLIKQLLAQ